MDQSSRYWIQKEHEQTCFNSHHVVLSSSFGAGDSWEEQAFAEDARGPLGGCIWPPRSYTCTFCRREFRSAQALGGHMNVHRRDRARLKKHNNNIQAAAVVDQQPDHTTSCFDHISHVLPPANPSKTSSPNNTTPHDQLDHHQTHHLYYSPPPPVSFTCSFTRSQQEHQSKGTAPTMLTSCSKFQPHKIRSAFQHIAAAAAADLGDDDEVVGYKKVVELNLTNTTTTYNYTSKKNNDDYEQLQQLANSQLIRKRCDDETVVVLPLFSKNKEEEERLIFKKIRRIDDDDVGGGVGSNFLQARRNSSSSSSGGLLLLLNGNEVEYSACATTTTKPSTTLENLDLELRLGADHDRRRL